LIPGYNRSSEEKVIWALPETESIDFRDYIEVHAKKWASVMGIKAPPFGIDTSDDDLYYETNERTIYLPESMAKLFDDKPSNFEDLLFWVAHEYFHHVIAIRKFIFETSQDEENQCDLMAEYLSNIRPEKAYKALHELLPKVWRTQIPVSLQEALERIPTDRTLDQKYLPAALAVIPTVPEPARPQRQDGLQYMADSPEYLTETIETIGWRDKIDQAFHTAIARAKGE